MLFMTLDKPTSPSIRLRWGRFDWWENDKIVWHIPLNEHGVICFKNIHLNYAKYRLVLAIYK